MRKIDSPLAIYLPRKTMKDKRMALNINVFRNLHYVVNNNCKVEYRKLMEEKLSGEIYKTPIIISFYLYKPSKRKMDRSNVLSIVEKFFCDSLTYYGCIPDDNDDFIQSTHYYSGDMDRKNPRVEIFIQEGYEN